MKETRIAEIRAAAPTAEDANGFYIEGLPIVYDTPTKIHDAVGEYIEIIKRGALDNADYTDCRLLYNHDLNKIPLARTPKTMQLTDSAAGLSMRASLPNTEAGRGVYEAIKRGDLSGMSFAFTVPKGGDVYDATTNTRTIYKIAKVYEVSIVPFPAYPQTSVEARAVMQATTAERLKLIKACNKILLKDV